VLTYVQTVTRKRALTVYRGKNNATGRILCFRNSLHHPLLHWSPEALEHRVDSDRARRGSVSGGFVPLGINTANPQKTRSIQRVFLHLQES
jgi:hypothetical protein